MTFSARLAKIKIQCFSMIPYIALSCRSKELHYIRIVAPLHHNFQYSILSNKTRDPHSHYPRSRKVFGEQIPRPQDTILRPSMISLPAQSMHKDDVDDGISIACVRSRRENLL